MEAKFCSSCGANLTEAVNFCPNCGFRISKVAHDKPSKSHLTIVVVAAAAIFSFGWLMQGRLAGKRPIKHAESPVEETTEAAGPSAELSAEFKALRQKAEGDPQNVTLWVAYAERLSSAIRAKPNPDQKLIFETIDVLRKILDLDAKNSFALIAMADISFEQQAFSKAAEFYKKYLAIEADDVGARARLASTLSFLGQYDQALEELRVAANKEPDSFPVRAYTAVVYAQMGDLDKARAKGRDALSIAPNDEARARFSEFMKKLDEPDAMRSVQGSTNQGPLTPGAEAIVAALKANPVAGSKFAGAELRDKELIVLFHDFPMSQMPGFAKDKFFKGIKDAAVKAKEEGIQTIIFSDSQSREELDKLTL